MALTYKTKPIYDLWKEKGCPCPPFEVYRSPEFESGMVIGAVIFYHPIDEMSIENVFFFESSSSKKQHAVRNTELFSDLGVDHDRTYI